MPARYAVALAGAVALIATVALVVGVMVGTWAQDAERDFCKQATSQSYCLDHPEKGDDIRLGA